MKEPKDRCSLYFPKIKEGISFHLNPSECIIFAPQAPLDGTSKVADLDPSEHSTRPTRTTLPLRMDVINHDAFKILSLCDGSLTETEILEKLSRGAGSGSPPISESLQKFTDFLEEAKRRDHIVFLTKREWNPTKPVVTGSTDFFIPFHISVELTRKCNLTCSYCYASANPANADEELSGSQLIEILSEWIAHGLKGIEITGGEPLLHKDFWKVLDFCLDNLCSVGLLSNGTLIDDAVADKLAQHREKLTLSVSLDGSNPQIHDKVSGIPGSFEKTARALRALVKRGLRVRVGMTVTPDNWKEIEPTLLLAKDMGATWFGWAPSMPFGRGCNVKWDLTCQEVIELGEKEKQLIESHRGFIPVVPKTTRFEPHSWNCGLGWKNVVVGPSGLVRPCLVFPESTFAFADLKKEHIPECFAKSILSRLRELPPPCDEICRDCELRIYCTTCPARGLSNREAASGKCSWVHATKSEDLVRMMEVA